MATKPQRNEVHICNAPNGHHLSVDCWCEPAAIRWIKNQWGVDILVVEHDDVTPQHRLTVIAERTRDCMGAYLNEPNNGWITRVLTPP